MKNILLLTIVFCAVGITNFSCKSDSKKPVNKIAIKAVAKLKVIDTPVVYIQPLGQVGPENIDVVVENVKSFFGYKCVVKPEVNLTPDLLAKSKTRYEASKILAKFDGKDNLLILTEKDIACKNDKPKVAEWGIFGLGRRPGKVCVISTFRLKRNVSKDLSHERLVKVCLHEIGHNIGLEHCTSGTNCMMNDANGTIREVDSEKLWFCEACMSKVKNKLK